MGVTNQSIKCTVMIVDDTVFMRDQLRDIMESSGFSVIAEASNGVEAVAKYWELCPNVTLMDVIMPNKNGIDATRDIIAFDKNAKVVMCSSIEHEALIVSANKAGARGVIFKPFVKKQVLEIVNSVIEN